MAMVREARIRDQGGNDVEQRLHRIEITTRGRGLVAITDQVCGWASRQGFVTGLLTIWCRHTSASLLVQENASPDVQSDLEAFFRRLVPEGGGRYWHEDEGPDDMPAHIRSALTQTQLSIPVAESQLVLGIWQGIYLWEHRASQHRRELVLHLLGEPVHA